MSVHGPDQAYLLHVMREFCRDDQSKDLNQLAQQCMDDRSRYLVAQSMVVKEILLRRCVPEQISRGTTDGGRGTLITTLCTMTRAIKHPEASNMM